MSQSKSKNLTFEAPKEEIAEEGNLHGWAVSYTDLLMNLVCFLIIFFNPDPVEIKTEVLAKTTPRPGYSFKEVPTFEHKVLDALEKDLSSFNPKIVVTPDEAALTIDFGENIYELGAYMFPLKQVERLKEILSKVYPKSKDLIVTFVGHADVVKVKHRPGAIIDSNLILSNLRAARAVEVALQLGFEPKFVRGEGASEFSRVTRSLSIKISERKSL
ncbi:MAG: hypothetical protein WCK43_08750 [bacterium]